MTAHHVFNALTELQMNQVLDMVEGVMKALSKGAETLWISLGPLAIGYLTWRLSKNRAEDKRERIEATENIKGAGSDRMDSIVSEIRENRELLSENTDLTKKLAVQRGLVTNGKKPSDGTMIEFDLELPGPAYERFDLSEGAPVMWKSEPCEDGMMARFVIAGQSQMGFHAHTVGERLCVVTGVLEIVTANGKFHIGPGQEFFSPPEEIHSVGFCGYGEVLAHWPGQTTNQLAIKIYQ